VTTGSPALPLPRGAGAWILQSAGKSAGVNPAKHCLQGAGVAVWAALLLRRGSFLQGMRGPRDCPALERGGEFERGVFGVLSGASGWTTRLLRAATMASWQTERLCDTRTRKHRLFLRAVFSALSQSRSRPHPPAPLGRPPRGGSLRRRCFDPNGRASPSGSLPGHMCPPPSPVQGQGCSGPLVPLVSLWERPWRRPSGRAGLKEEKGLVQAFETSELIV